MAEDFGDEAGQKLVDWATRIAMYQTRVGGPAHGERAMREAADQLTRALETARDSLRDPASTEVRTDLPALPEWAKLDLAEFQAMDGYEEIRSAIDLKLASASVEHALYEEGGHAYLLFRSQDAPRVADCLDSLAGQARQAAERAAGRVREQHRDVDHAERDREPLERRAQRARESADAISHGEEPERDLSRGSQRREERPR
ncbi:hypothetical protein [Bacteroides zoogleoformans]|uniref:hypothetical protein n=1 Tax=Bacteroides zoogleoformans TaxID=28119 RepID=UPI00248E22A9|nr:hypothetical protein [Bacteroides zoogleoformans]